VPNLATRTGLSLPALRGRQGTRTMYLVLPTNNVLNTFFTTEMEPVDDRSQRQLDPKHARKIGDYIVANPTEYALGAITYAVDQEGEFEPFEEGADIGVLHLPLNARLRSVDGQHRRRGIKEAIDVIAEVGEEHTALLIYVESRLDKRKQMFSDMNNTARVVSKAINVAFDSRDPFARAVNALVESHPLLVGRVETEATRVRAGSNALYTLGALHDAVKRLFVGQAGRVRQPDQFSEDDIHDRSMQFFDLLRDARPEFGQATDEHALDELRSRNILFSSTTLRVIAGAVHEHVRRAGTADPQTVLKQLVEPLAAVDFSPGAPLWRDSGFVTPGRTTPNARAQEIREATRTLTAHLTDAT
jgi:DGQHR domain-containing protein